MSDVSRETPPPTLAAEVFSHRLNIAVTYARHLATSGVERGLIGPREVPRLWDRHLLNSAVVVPRVPQGASVADVGSGAGLPGLVWAIARPDLTVTLIEPLLRRTTFLEEMREELGLQDQVRVIRGRADEVHETFDVVTARAVAPLDKLGGWCLPLVRDGGVFLALKGSNARAELAASRHVLSLLGGKNMLVTTYGDLEIPTTVVEVSK
ncbi:MAG: 16S rRNA (guanine(527)-N(7))-methyltransferase RsmG [Propionibacteriales bacterium]|nr:16S rRNA (guanine(527)-N(7))-methyltransferase RsmG [Propionibacteriales bacterium]